MSQDVAACLKQAAIEAREKAFRLHLNRYPAVEIRTELLLAARTAFDAGWHGGYRLPFVAVEAVRGAMDDPSEPHGFSPGCATGPNPDGGGR